MKILIYVNCCKLMIFDIGKKDVEHLRVYLIYRCSAFVKWSCWPSYIAAVPSSANSVLRLRTISFLMKRIMVLSARCCQRFV